MCDEYDVALQEMTDIDLEAKEHQLRLLNEQLDQRRDEIVERAEKLLVYIIIILYTVTNQTLLKQTKLKTEKSKKFP